MTRSLDDTVAAFGRRLDEMRAEFDALKQTVEAQMPHSLLDTSQPISAATDDTWEVIERDPLTLRAAADHRTARGGWPMPTRAGQTYRVSYRLGGDLAEAAKVRVSPDARMHYREYIANSTAPAGHLDFEGTGEAVHVGVASTSSKGDTLRLGHLSVSEIASDPPADEEDDPEPTPDPEPDPGPAPQHSIAYAGPGFLRVSGLPDEGTITIEISHHEIAAYNGTYSVAVADLAAGPVWLVPPAVSGLPFAGRELGPRPSLIIAPEDLAEIARTYTWADAHEGDTRIVDAYDSGREMQIVETLTLADDETVTAASPILTIPKLWLLSPRAQAIQAVYIPAEPAPVTASATADGVQIEME